MDQITTKESKAIVRNLKEVLQTLTRDYTAVHIGFNNDIVEIRKFFFKNFLNAWDTLRLNHPGTPNPTLFNILNGVPPPMVSLVPDARVFLLTLLSKLLGNH